MGSAHPGQPPLKFRAESEFEIRFEKLVDLIYMDLWGPKFRSGAFATLFAALKKVGSAVKIKGARTLASRFGF